MWDSIQSLNVPDWVTKNALTALGKGIYGIVEEGAKIPKNLLLNINENIVLKGDLKREFVKTASQHHLSQIASNPEFSERVLRSFGLKMIEEQINKESIAEKMVKGIEESISDIDESTEPNEISNDWLTAFWELAASKSEEDMQEILGKILANEITAPKSMSLHTLQTISVLDSKVGNSFRKLCNLSIDDGDAAFVIHPSVFAFQNIGPLDQYGITFNELLNLDGANLIRSAETIMLNYGKNDKLKEGEFDYQKVNYAGRPYNLDVSGKQLHLLFFTQSGRELRRLIDMTPDHEYTKTISEKLGENFKEIKT